MSYNVFLLSVDGYHDDDMFIAVNPEDVHDFEQYAENAVTSGVDESGALRGARSVICVRAEKIPKRWQRNYGTLLLAVRYDPENEIFVRDEKMREADASIDPLDYAHPEDALEEDEDEGDDDE